MRAAPSGLRHPASASCLGRHSHLAGRCPNNSSLFPPLAAVVVVAAEKLFFICNSGKSADFPELLFHRVHCAGFSARKKGCRTACVRQPGVQIKGDLQGS